MRTELTTLANDERLGHYDGCPICTLVWQKDMLSRSATVELGMLMTIPC